MTPSAVYVYGVLPASELRSISASGVEGAPVHPVELGGLAAITSEVKGDALAAAREVRAHWKVLDEISQSTTVLPARFGTVMGSDDEVRERLLAPNAERLEDLLRGLAGHVQLGVKGDYDGRELMRDVVRSSPTIAALRDKLRELPDAAGYYERIRLGELVAAEVEQRRDADRQLALDLLTPEAADAREEELSHAEAAFNLAFLVARERQDAFTKAVNRLSDKLGDRVAIRYVGPLPPYSFAEADLSAGSEAWV